MTLRRLHLLILALTGILLGVPAIAQQLELPRIGVLWPGDVAVWNKAFLDGLRDNGFVDGVSAAIYVRNTGGNIKSGPAFAKELIALDPDVLFASPGALAQHLLKELEAAGRNVPMVVLTWDPLEEGIVSSTVRPGRNVTGIGRAPDPEFMTKYIQLIKELAPRTTRVVYFLDATWYLRKFFDRSKAVLDKAGHQIGILVTSIEVKGPEGLEDAFYEAVRQRAQAIIISVGPTFAAHRDRVTHLAAKHRLTAIYGDELYAYKGGLISYGASISEMERRAGAMVARVLRGARPADMPIEYPTRYRLVVNMRTAATLDLEIPQSILIQADEVVR